jgi:hypothetical protein
MTVAIRHIALIGPKSNMPKCLTCPRNEYAGGGPMITFKAIKELRIPTFVSTEQAVEWGSHLNAEEHATLVERQRGLSNTAVAECNLRRMVTLATQAKLMRDAAGAFAPA